MVGFIPLSGKKYRIDFSRMFILQRGHPNSLPFSVHGNNRNAHCWLARLPPSRTRSQSPYTCYVTSFQLWVWASSQPSCAVSAPTSKPIPCIRCFGETRRSWSPCVWYTSVFGYNFEPFIFFSLYPCPQSRHWLSRPYSHTESLEKHQKAFVSGQ